MYDGCSLHYFSGSDAERDIDRLAGMIDDRARLGKEHLHYTSNEKTTGRVNSASNKIHIKLIPRLPGQGGFASDEITVTDADDNPAASNIDLIIQHELIHILDHDLGCEPRPPDVHLRHGCVFDWRALQSRTAFLRAAALLRDGSYMPLNILCEDFLLAPA